MRLTSLLVACALLLCLGGCSLGNPAVRDMERWLEGRHDVRTYEVIPQSKLGFGVSSALVHAETANRSDAERLATDFPTAVQHDLPFILQVTWPVQGGTSGVVGAVQASGAEWDLADQPLPAASTQRLVGRSDDGSAPPTRRVTYASTDVLATAAAATGLGATAVVVTGPDDQRLEADDEGDLRARARSLAALAGAGVPLAIDGRGVRVPADWFVDAVDRLNGGASWQVRADDGRATIDLPTAEAAHFRAPLRQWLASPDLVAIQVTARQARLTWTGADGCVAALDALAATLLTVQVTCRPVAGEEMPNFSATGTLAQVRQWLPELRGVQQAGAQWVTRTNSGFALRIPQPDGFDPVFRALRQASFGSRTSLRVHTGSGRDGLRVTFTSASDGTATPVEMPPGEQTSRAQDVLTAWDASR